jgi:hypothetical protein
VLRCRPAARDRARTGAPRRRDDRGSAQVELVVLAIVSFLFIAFIVFVGRLNVGSASAEAAARSAAPAISDARDPYQAVAAAEEDAASMVKLGSAMCASWSFVPDIEPGEQVTVTITCNVDLSEASLIEVPGSLPIEATATEVIDQYREGTPGPAEGAAP